MLSLCLEEAGHKRNGALQTPALTPSRLSCEGTERISWEEGEQEGPGHLRKAIKPPESKTPSNLSGECLLREEPVVPGTSPLPWRLPELGWADWVQGPRATRS